MNKSERDSEDGKVEDALLNPERYAGTDWFTKLVIVERAKTFRREAQKARKGKPVTFSEADRWPQSE